MEGAMTDLTPDAQAAFERWQDIKNWSDYVNVAEYARGAFFAGRASLVDASDTRAIWSALETAALASHGNDFEGVVAAFRAELRRLGLRIVVDATTKEPS
jgi:hypothetical protein